VAITKASGVLEAHVRVSGSARDPQMSGGVGITNGAFTVASTGVAYTGLNGRIDLQPGRAVFNGVQVADSHRKTLTIGGDVSLEQKALGNLALAIKSRDFEVLDNDLGRVSLDTDVKVGGRVAAPRIEGTVSVGSGEINIDRVLELASSSAYATTPQAGATPGGLTETAADPAMPAPAGRDAVPVPAAASVVGTVPTLPVGGGAASPAQAAPAAAKTEPFNAMMLNVRLHVPPSLVVKGKDLRPGGGAIGLGDVNVTLGGDVRMEKAPAGPLRLLGQVTTVRGTYDFQGRRFDIQRDGRVRFEGGLPLDPALDITATRLISGVEARVHVGGTSRRPELTLTSRPPLDQADILALIVFNQPANQLGEGQQASLAERAGALATGFVASKLADSIGSALNLDTFEIQTAPESSGGQGALVTVGEQLGQRLFVKLTQGVGSENLSQFVIDYQFTDIVRLSTTITQGESVTRSLVRRVERSGVDLIFFFSY
jgi:autotransporter translocation and assembly factor TamB